MPIEILRGVDEARAACDHARSAGHRVGLVPTMGALHEGHLALVHEARRRAGESAAWVMATIFVNPTQFGPNEDFARYPRDLESDVAKLAAAGCDAVFAPEPSAMYPEGDETRVRVGPTAAPLCGAFRPVHFEGVTTVVAKLFAIAGPCVAVFGMKDYQQLQVIRRMSRDLFFPVQVLGHPIVREADGLALSSRNAYLTAEERERALGLSRGLAQARRAWAGGERDPLLLRAVAYAEVVRVATSIDYVEVLHPESLASFAPGEKPERALVAIACHVGKTRLIDNAVLGDAL